MNGLDQKADMFLDVCQEFLVGEFGERATLGRYSGRKIMTARSVAPQDGSAIRCFGVGERVWQDMEDDFETNVVVAHDGKVSVSYPCQDVDHGGMNFVVGHPREVSELFHLLVNPASCMTSGEEVATSSCKLGDLVDFHILVPDGDVWRMLDLANLPAGAPSDFLEMVFFDAVQDWDKLCMGKTVEACKVAGLWPDFVKSLPEVSNQLKAGYLLAPNSSIQTALDLAANGPENNRTFLDLILVPKEKAVSCLYLREHLVRDKEMGKAIGKAFAAATSLATLRENLATVNFHMPVKYHHQIRVAAEHILIREWLRYVTNSLVDQRDCYLMQDERQWHQAHALSQMVRWSEE